MRLVNTTTLCIEPLSDAQVSKTPYAILSHVWGPDEILLHEVQEGQIGIKDKAGWKKMANFCATARKHGYDYAWIDTCCIDKRSTVELTEAINSNYKYYYNAAACFIYLEDVQKWSVDKGGVDGSEDGDSKIDVSKGVAARGILYLFFFQLLGLLFGWTCLLAARNRYNKIRDDSKGHVVVASARSEVSRDILLSAIRNTRWLSRGWTLQELLAPSRRCFFATDWSEIDGGDDLLDTLADATGIDKSLLQDRDLLSTYCVGERMSWAALRKTSKGEDVAYSLMGLFGVYMPIMYGEGAESAFKRLQREIMQASFDMTIFAWRANYESSGLLARSPADFTNTPSLGLWAPWSLSSFAMTNIGIALRLNIVREQPTSGDSLAKYPENYTCLAALQCDIQTPMGECQVPLIYLEQVEGTGFFTNGRKYNAYRRVRCLEWRTLPPEQIRDCPSEDILVLTDEQHQLVRRATERHISRHKVESGIVRSSTSRL
ncbi:HET-domain-containing protein [Hypoxylon fragiforme]|uniref:HET-domain-containing protein n=1 Tax=Hypoxylon fragiforme TaxID=63214 RepID=UPI0020C630FE|nr:HET-domain-containing protein [Hypoxylon fragiforme]KAI2613724.1 HET-domain-containing protein [Hypoxylon fragiforme]